MSDTNKMTHKSDTAHERDEDGRFVSEEAASTGKASPAKGTSTKAADGKTTKSSDMGHAAYKSASASHGGTSAKSKDDSHAASHASTGKTRGS